MNLAWEMFGVLLWYEPHRAALADDVWDGMKHAIHTRMRAAT